MSPATATPEAPARDRPRLFAPDAIASRGRTLEEAVLDAERELRLRGNAACLVCGEPVEASGECRACGSKLD
jgi:hypothetical protein